MPYKYVVTHHGQAHRDEFVACAIALALFPSIAAIFRRDPTPEELANPDVLVLDVGGEHDPNRGNFDHHQLPRDAAPACALSLFIDALGFRERFELMAWYAATAIMDSKGPMALAKHLGLATPDAVFKNMSPVEGAMISLFEKRTEMRPLTIGYAGGCDASDIPEPLWDTMQVLGRSMLANANELWEQREWLSANAKMIDVGGVPTMVIESSNTKGTQQFRDTRCPGVAICLSYDDRGAGWSLYRFNDDPRVDFSRLSDEAVMVDGRVLFAHAGGFIAKTRARLPLDEVLALVTLALRPDPEKLSEGDLREALAARAAGVL